MYHTSVNGILSSSAPSEVESFSYLSSKVLFISFNSALRKFCRVPQINIVVGAQWFLRIYSMNSIRETFKTIGCSNCDSILEIMWLYKTSCVQRTS